MKLPNFTQQWAHHSSPCGASRLRSYRNTPWTRPDPIQRCARTKTIRIGAPVTRSKNATSLGGEVVCRLRSAGDVPRCLASEELLSDAESEGIAPRRARRVVHDPRQEVVRPARDEVQEDDQRGDRRRERHRDAREHLPFAAAVEPRRLDQRVEPLGVEVECRRGRRRTGTSRRAGSPPAGSVSMCSEAASRKSGSTSALVGINMTSIVRINSARRPAELVGRNAIPGRNAECDGDRRSRRGVERPS